MPDSNTQFKKNKNEKHAIRCHQSQYLEVTQYFIFVFSQNVDFTLSCFIYSPFATIYCIRSDLGVLICYLLLVQYMDSVYVHDYGNYM